MSETQISVEPKLTPPLHPDFVPAALYNRAYLAEVERSGQGQALVIGVERTDGTLSRYETQVFSEAHPQASLNNFYVERIVKFMLWQRGGYKVYVGGPSAVGKHIQQVYSPAGERQFDFHFMGEKVYERTFEVIVCSVDEVPAVHETGKQLGRHLEGCRIGFDLGASDRKVSAVIDGEVVYSEEIVWEPVEQTDPNYHYTEVMAALNTAASKMPRVDSVGGSSAGIYIDNSPRVASLYRGIPKERFGEIKNLFLRIRDELAVPMEVINDGDVTALAGAMSLDDNGVLGIAMGSSEATGYVDLNGNIMGWLNELAFAPVDYGPSAARWSTLFFPAVRLPLSPESWN
jgi:hypothetical protein